MRRGETGRYEITTAGGEQVRAFMPNPLPPTPPLDLGPLQPGLEQALLMLGRLDGLATVLPDTGMFLYGYVRKEAVLSSQIEGTQSSLSDLLLFELTEADSVPADDVVEVSNYVAALEHGLSRLHGGFPLSNRLIREIHGVLMRRGRGSGMDPGHFRRSQNWSGGSRPGNAAFVPPPAHAVGDCMSDLERFLHAPAPELPAVVKAGLAHAQFETIHPFLDGNGRVGRLLITLLLCHHRVLKEPLLYLSLYFKERRQDYYELLDGIRRGGDWEAWLRFFLEGVAQTAGVAVSTAMRLDDLFRKDRERIEQEARAAGSVLRLHRVLCQRPITSLRQATTETVLSAPTVAAAMRELERLRIALEITGRRKGRLFAYQRSLAIMSEGTELP